MSPSFYREHLTLSVCGVQAYSPKTQPPFAVKFVLLSIDFESDLGYNLYCDKNVKVYELRNDIYGR